MSVICFRDVVFAKEALDYYKIGIELQYNIRESDKSLVLKS